VAAFGLAQQRRNVPAALVIGPLAGRGAVDGVAHVEPGASIDGRLSRAPASRMTLAISAMFAGRRS
jgi:hypothetical protein